MKKLLLIPLIAYTLFVGCKATTPLENTIVVEKIVIKSVDTGMLIWKDMVVAGKANQSQIDAVHQLYDGYYLAQMTAKAAIEQVIISGSTNTTEVAIANTAVLNAENLLLAKLNSLILK